MNTKGMLLLVLTLLAACHRAPPQVSIAGAKAEMSPALVGEAMVSLTIVNQGGADELTGVRVDQDGATASFHMMQGARMITVDTMPVPARETLVLKLNGSHIMLEDLSPSVREGSSLIVTLVFKKSGEKQLPLTLQKPPSPRLNQGGR